MALLNRTRLSIRLPRSLPMLTGSAALAVMLLFFIYLIIGVGQVETRDTNSEGIALASCIENYKTSVGVDHITVPALYSLNGFCFDSIGSQLKLDQEKIRRDNFIFQRNENVVLLYMVVVITLSGVILAGLQLLASYKLAVRGHGDLTGGGEITYTGSGASFKSSVVGLTILALSFAFFLVFIIYVYTFTDSSTVVESRASAPPNNLLTTLVPVSPNAKERSVQSTVTTTSTGPGRISNTVGQGH